MHQILFQGNPPLSQDLTVSHFKAVWYSGGMWNHIPNAHMSVFFPMAFLSGPVSHASDVKVFGLVLGQVLLVFVLSPYLLFVHIN